MSAFKLGRLTAGGEEVPFRHPDIWLVQRTTGPGRLAIAPASDHVETILALSAAMPEPFWVLYVLIVSHTGRSVGRWIWSGLRDGDAEGV